CGRQQRTRKWRFRPPVQAARLRLTASTISSSQKSILPIKINNQPKHVFQVTLGSQGILRPGGGTDSAPTTMDFDQLKTFLEVAKLGNFSRAAEKVLRSQPAVSAQIRQLEREYGQRLFDRSSKRVRLTPAGEVVRDYALQMLLLYSTSLHAVT